MFYISFTPPCEQHKYHIHILKISRFIFIRRTWFTFYSCCSRTYPSKATVHSLWQEHKDQSYCCVRKSWLCIHEHFVWNVTIVKVAPNGGWNESTIFCETFCGFPTFLCSFFSLTFSHWIVFCYFKNSIWNFMTKNTLYLCKVSSFQSHKLFQFWEYLNVIPISRTRIIQIWIFSNFEFKYKYL